MNMASMLDLTKNRFSSQYRMDNDKKSDWFRMLDSKLYMWDRRGEYLEGFVDPSRYSEAQEAIRAMGGAIMDKKFDKISGKNWVKIKEPKFK